MGMDITRPRVVGRMDVRILRLPVAADLVGVPAYVGIKERNGSDEMVQSDV